MNECCKICKDISEQVLQELVFFWLLVTGSIRDKKLYTEKLVISQYFCYN